MQFYEKFLTMQIARLTIELTLVIILSLIIVLFAIEDINFEEASIKLGLFAAAALDFCHLSIKLVHNKF